MQHLECLARVRHWVVAIDASLILETSQPRTPNPYNGVNHIWPNPNSIIGTLGQPVGDRIQNSGCDC
jgi:hypothetical protein